MGWDLVLGRSEKMIYALPISVFPDDMKSILK
jgi:hypothetical protein